MSTKWARTADTAGPRPNLLPRSDVQDRTCSILGCARPYYCRSWCKSHYVVSTLNTDAARNLLAEIERLDYGAYDAAREFMVKRLGSKWDGEDWAEALAAIEREAVARAEHLRRSDNLIDRIAP